MAGRRKTRTALRARRRRRYAAQVIDTHAHWYPQEFIALLQREAAANGARMDRNSKGQPVFSLPNLLPHSTMVPEMVEPGLILEQMDRRRIDTFALSLTNPMVYWAPPEFGLKLSRTWNDACAAVHEAHPRRFIGTIMLPLQAPELAVRGLRRASRLPGMRAVYMATHVNGKNLDDESLWPVYAGCETLDLPIFLHPLYPCAFERMNRYFMRNLCGNPYETGLAAASLVLGGVLDAFPKLEVMLPQAGGTFPWLAGRFDRGMEVRPELRHLRHRPTEYLRRFHYDTITHHPAILRFLVELVGADRVVLGSDYNQDMCYDRPVDFVEQVPGLSARERELILCGNARKLLKL